MNDDPNFHLSTELVIPHTFPKVYENERGEVIVYLGAISRNSREMFIGGCPYWLQGKHSTGKEAEKAIQGFYRLENGVIFKDSFLDDTTGFPFPVSEKNAYVDLPKSVLSYGIRTCKTHEEDGAATRQAFGLTYEELCDVLDLYAKLFGLGNVYQRFPRITRSTQRDNCCDLSHAWIPRTFPYIAFDESAYPFSHVSLGAFYEHMRLLLLHESHSMVWKAMVELGANEELLEYIINMQAPYQPPIRYNEFIESW